MKNILPVHQRLAELYTINKMRDLSFDELDEISACLQINAKLCWDAAYQENMKFMDNIVRDIDYKHEISIENDMR
jgi:hypothetical protein